MRFLFIENGSYSKPDLSFFSRSNRRLRNGSEGKGAVRLLPSLILAAGGCGAISADR